jgi:hypothetical protein
MIFLGRLTHFSKQTSLLLPLIVRHGADAGAAGRVAGCIGHRSIHRVDPASAVAGTLGAELDAPTADDRVRRRVAITGAILRLIAAVGRRQVRSRGDE